MPGMRRTFALAAVALVTLAGCSARATQQSAPDLEPSGVAAGTHVKVFQMPSGFRNVAFECNGSTGIYVTSRGANQGTTDDASPLPSSIAAVPHDPACA